MGDLREANKSRFIEWFQVTKDIVKEKALSLDNGEKFVASNSFVRFMKEINDPNFQKVDMILNNEEEIQNVQTKNPSNHEILHNNHSEVTGEEENIEESYEVLENSIFIKEEPVQWT